jgi:hypothetical protein
VPDSFAIEADDTITGWVLTERVPHRAGADHLEAVELGKRVPVKVAREHRLHTELSHQFK